eukprot:COSAG05_NODE_9545_length_616_cov_3.547389_1_plen_40_part_10
MARALRARLGRAVRALAAVLQALGLVIIESEAGVTGLAHG